jgi:hypothetical protein
LSGTNLDTRADARVVRSTEAHEVLSQRLTNSSGMNLNSEAKRHWPQRGKVQGSTK